MYTGTKTTKAICLSCGHDLLTIIKNTAKIILALVAFPLVFFCLWQPVFLPILTWYDPIALAHLYWLGLSIFMIANCILAWALCVSIKLHEYKHRPEKYLFWAISALSGIAAELALIPAGATIVNHDFSYRIAATAVVVFYPICLIGGLLAIVILAM